MKRMVLFGDNYSFINPDSGLAVMTLSDGMGTGGSKKAKR